MEKDKERMRIGQRIAELRSKQMITQRELAERCGIKQPHIARIERGAYSVGFDTLQTIAEALGTDVDFKERG